MPRHESHVTSRESSVQMVTQKAKCMAFKAIRLAFSLVFGSLPSQHSSGSTRLGRPGLQVLAVPLTGQAILGKILDVSKPLILMFVLFK